MQIDPFSDTLSTHHQIFVKRLMTYWNEAAQWQQQQQH